MVIDDKIIKNHIIKKTKRPFTLIVSFKLSLIEGIESFLKL